MKTLLLFLVLILPFEVFAQTGPDPFATWLQSLDRPVFNPASRLKPLTYTGWNWQLSNAAVTLATDYGYAAQAPAPVLYFIGLSTNPASTVYGLAQHAYANTNFILSTTVIKTPTEQRTQIVLFRPTLTRHSPLVTSLNGCHRWLLRPKSTLNLAGYRITFTMDRWSKVHTQMRCRGT